MTQKKNPKYSLENRRSYFFQFGLVIGLAVTLVAFEWTTFTVNEQRVGGCFPIDESELPPYEWTPAPPPDQHEQVIEEIDDVFEIDEDESDDQEVEETELSTELTNVGELGGGEVYVQDSLIPAPPKRPRKVWEVDDLPYLCECAEERDSLARELCTRAGIKRSLNSMEVPEIWVAAGGRTEVIYVQFVIDVDGRTKQLLFADEDTKHASLIRESRDGIEGLPCFVPAMAEDEAVPMYYTLPITFKVR